MKRILFVMTLFLVACGNNNTAPAPTAEPEVPMVTYQGERLTIDYPEDWAVVERPQDIVFTDLFGIDTAEEVTGLTGRLDGSILYLYQFSTFEIENGMFFHRSDPSFEELILERFATEMQFTEEELSPAPFRLDSGQIGLSVNELKEMEHIFPGVTGSSYITLGTIYDDESEESVAILMAFTPTRAAAEEIQSLFSSIEFNSVVE